MKEYLFPIIKKIVPFILKNYENIKLLYQTKVKYKNENIRLSISYLYRIKVDNKYLLVKSNRIPNQFQPVGGVYKFKPSAKNVLNKLKVVTESGYNYDDDLKDDLRVKVIGKNVIQFIDWFKSREDRETDPTREFREELLDTKILTPKSKFENINYNHIETVICPLERSDKFGCLEILIRDIYDFEPNTEQEKILRKLLNSETDKYKWFESEEIRRLGRTNDRKEYIVGKHTLSIL